MANAYNDDDDDYEMDDEPIVTFMTRDEKAIEDFEAGNYEYLRVGGYRIDGKRLLNNFGDQIN